MVPLNFIILWIPYFLFLTILLSPLSFSFLSFFSSFFLLFIFPLPFILNSFLLLFINLTIFLQYTRKDGLVGVYRLSWPERKGTSNIHRRSSRLTIRQGTMTFQQFTCKRVHGISCPFLPVSVYGLTTSYIYRSYRLVMVVSVRSEFSISFWIIKTTSSDRPEIIGRQTN